MTESVLHAIAPTAAGCAHCGLPSLPGDRYCCYGCELAHEIAAEAERDHARTRSTLTFSLLLSMSVMMLSLFLYAEDIYDVDEAAGLEWMRKFYRFASFALTTPVMVLCGVPLVRRALKRARAGQLSMSALIAAGAIAAYVLSVWSLARGGREIYFDSAATSLVLATLGRYLEARARTKASGMIGQTSDPSTARVRRIRADREVEWVGPAELVPGDQIEVGPEGVVPVDLLLEGETVELDLGVLTGESTPVTVRPGEVVSSGAVAISGGLNGRVLRIARDSTRERLAQLARSLREQPSALLRLADAFARGLTPLVWALALGTLGVWTSRANLETGVVNALAVVLVACPCSYAIATPLVHWLAMRRALASGVVIRSADALERLADLRHLAFDKTGTLTSPRLSVRAVALAADAEPSEVRNLVRALEEGSPHPVARALMRYSQGAIPLALTHRRFEPGRGVAALDAQGRKVELRASGEDVVCLRDERVLASFTLDEELRPEATAAVRALNALGIEVSILTGDSPLRAERVARALDVPFSAGLRPEAKVEALRALGPGTGMVGDGLNDAPALAGVTSFAIHGATGLSRGLAQVTLQSDDLTLVPESIALARRARRVARRLLIGSTVYNLVFLALAASGALRPVWAGVSMLLSSLLILAAATAVTPSGPRRDPAKLGPPLPLAEGAP